MLKWVSVAVSVALLAGCATALTSHNPTGATLSELAIVAVEDKGAWRGDYEIQASIERAFDSSGAVVIRPDMFTDQRGDFRLQQGEYQFIIRCETRGVYNAHRIDIELKAGERYVAYCLGTYKDWLIGDEIAGILGFISNAKEEQDDKVRNQATVDRAVEAE
jgi:hypothetical protein